MSYQLSDGASVSYIGDGHDGRVLGERGELLTTAGRTAHVKWVADGQIQSHDIEDIAPASLRGLRTAVVRDELDDMLDLGPIVTTGVRHALDTEGAAGVLNALASGGHLGDFPVIAEDVVAMVEQRIRASASFREVARQLDDEEFDEVTQLAARALLRDAFGAVDE